MSTDSHAGSLWSFLYRRLIVPWLVIGTGLVVLAANGWASPSISIAPLPILVVALVLLLWKILAELRSISELLAAGE